MDDAELQVVSDIGFHRSRNRLHRTRYQCFYN
jgi:hypothetical protein